jgi:CheY-like chemotaxis protein
MLPILFAEDNPTNRKLTLRQLEKLGYTAECAEDGARPTPCGRPATTACC